MSHLNRARWLLNRFRSMPPREWAHRVREQVRKRQDRRKTWPMGWNAQWELPAWPTDSGFLRENTSGKARKQLRKEAETLFHGPIPMLGTEWAASQRRQWLLDPVTQQSWPDTYTYDIEYRQGPTNQDPKFCLEFNRLQHLQILALAGHVLDEPKYTRACLDDLDHWLQNVRPFHTLAWSCGVECASRVLSLLLIIGLVGRQEIPPDLARRLQHSLTAHAWWLERYPSLYSSANNHRLAELTGLVVLGCLWTQHPHASVWRENLAELCREAHQQILPDGGGAEQSLTYQAYAMEWLLTAHFATQHFGQPSRMGTRLVQGARFLQTFADRAGHFPAIGDDDESAVVRVTLHNEHYIHSICGLTSGLFDQADCTTSHSTQDLRAALFGVHVQSAQPQASKATVFEETGYTVLRRSADYRETLVVFDHGPLGYAYTAGHGHADALSVWLHLDGEPLLIDSGTYRYNGLPQWRQWARSTAAHNTVTVNHQDQSLQAGPFNWGPRAQCTLLQSNGLQGQVSAEHTGYATLGFTHRRTVHLSPQGVLHIEDQLLGTDTCTAHSYLHFAPHITVQAATPHSWNLLKDDRIIATVQCTGSEVSGTIHRDGEHPGPGTCSPHYNILAATDCLVLRVQVRGNTKWLVEIRPIKEPNQTQRMQK